MRSTGRVGTISATIGLLAFVEFTSGVLQAYYTPMFTDIARHLGIHDADVNWLEGAQLALAAVSVPALARLGDMFGYRRMLLVSMAVTGLGALALPFSTAFPVFLAAWALMGVGAVWLPLEIALLWSRSRSATGRSGGPVRAAGLLVAALEIGAIVGALSGGALAGLLPLPVVLAFPAVLTAIAVVVVLVGVEEPPVAARGAFDGIGFALLALALLSAISGMSVLRSGAAWTSIWPWGACSAILLMGFVAWELRSDDPLIDVRVFRSRSLAPLFATAGLFGLSVLGAQAPLSTFARTDPSVHGYGLGATSFEVSLLVGAYVLAMAAGALCYSLAVRRARTRLLLAASSGVIGLGFALFLLRHDETAQVMRAMAVIGLGAGALMAALPASAAAAAPPGGTGVSTALTNSVKTLGGVVAACAFGVALTVPWAGRAPGTAPALESYLSVWAVSCGAALLAAVIVLVFYREQASERRAGVHAVDRSA